MAWEKKVVWTEGMMLQPQHFQQQTRYHDAQLSKTLGLISPYAWGFANFEVDTSQLLNGKICLDKAEGILPDGSYFHLGQQDGIPKAIDVDESLLGKRIYLAVNIRRHGNTEISREGDELQRYRNRVSEIEIRDINTENSLSQAIEVAGFNFSLLTENDDLSEFCCLPFAVVEDISAEGKIKLQADFIPSMINIKKCDYVSSFISELVTLCQHRVTALAQRVSVAGRASTSEVTDFLMLQTLNRHLPILSDHSQADFVGSKDLFEKWCYLIGDMSTFINEDKLVPELPTYQQKNSSDIFNQLIKHLRQLFSVVLEQNSIAIPLEEKKYGIRIGQVADATLFASGNFVLAVSADLSVDDLRQYFPAQVKVGAVEQIKELVNVQLPGIQLSSLAVAPREIPYKRGYVYFELVQQGEYWQALTQSGGIALHIGTNFPNLDLELWAIRGN
ncbi:type VI secretion system baseplate subunit TssK [Catenovulum sp. SM1970]|uniref:type VI secretion system baseplate subunit TssK n=1 Tax=Marinifaba aquimaris TaxID=2741323 RepID=UPI001574602E|nr:type VI secretion system baseplate subunit TssK [Marinifaba aquimaris]NTS75638.1 type VI secretion system baseplate subunit TssK [Marinifaba aquimaris]